MSGACLGHHLGHVCGIIWGNQMSYWDLHVTTHSASKLYETRWILTSFAASQPDKIFMSIKVLSIRPFIYLDKFEFLHIHIFGFIWIFLAIMSSCGRFTHHVYNIFVQHLVCNTKGWQCRISYATVMLPLVYCRPSHRLFSPTQQQPLSKGPPQVGTINNQVKEGSAGLIKRKEVRKEPPHSEPESPRGN